MSATHVMPLGPILRQREAQIKDKGYQQSGVGRDVRRYIAVLRWADKSQNTVDSYETTLAKLAIEHDDFEGLQDFCSQMGTEYLREFLSRNWQDAAPATKANRVAAVRSLFAWASSKDVGICSYNPAREIKAPRGRPVEERVAFSQDILYELVMSQPSRRDRCCLQLMGRMALRKNEVRMLKVKDIDLIRNLITIHGKGGVVAVLPLKLKTLRDEIAFHVQADERKLDEHLLYPHNFRHEPMHPVTMHRWFKTCLERAGLPETIKMHELRHTAADHLYRETGDIVRAQQLLRHSSITTTQSYIHPTRQDLADSLEAIDVAWANR